MLTCITPGIARDLRYHQWLVSLSVLICLVNDTLTNPYRALQVYSAEPEQWAKSASTFAAAITDLSSSGGIKRFQQMRLAYLVGGTYLYEDLARAKVGNMSGSFRCL